MMNKIANGLLTVMVCCIAVDIISMTDTGKKGIKKIKEVKDIYVNKKNTEN